MPVFGTVDNTNRNPRWNNVAWRWENITGQINSGGFGRLFRVNGMECRLDRD